MLDAGAPRYHFHDNDGITPVFYHLFPFTSVFDPSRLVRCVSGFCHGCHGGFDAPDGMLQSAVYSLKLRRLMAGPGLSADWEHLRYEVCPSQGGWGGSSGHTQPQGGHLVTLGLCSLGHLTAVLTSKPVLVQILLQIITSTL